MSSARRQPRRRHLPPCKSALFARREHPGMVIPIWDAGLVVHIQGRCLTLVRALCPACCRKQQLKPQRAPKEALQSSPWPPSGFAIIPRPERPWFRCGSLSLKVCDLSGRKQGRARENEEVLDAVAHGLVEEPHVLPHCVGCALEPCLAHRALASRKDLPRPQHV